MSSSLTARRYAVSLAYDRAGTGAPLLLIHGLGHRRQGWDAVLPQLTPHREVISLDLPGHGESPPLRAEGKNAVAVMADEVEALMSTLGLDRPHVAGNSLGGGLALVLASRGLAASATVLSPAGFPNHRYQTTYARVFFEVALISGRVLRPAVPSPSLRPSGRAALFGMVVAKPGRLSGPQVVGDMAGMARASAAVHAVFASFEPFTHGIPDDVPVTIAWGAKDKILSPANARVARQRLPRARFVSLDGCGHVPMTDDPDLIAKVLLDGSSQPADGASGPL
jgi:pimeloyl-ACP methyl ester carboxylesterase